MSCGPEDWTTQLCSMCSVLPQYRGLYILWCYRRRPSDVRRQRVARGLTKASDRQRINSAIDRTDTAHRTDLPRSHLMNIVKPPTMNCSAIMSNHVLQVTHTTSTSTTTIYRTTELRYNLPTQHPLTTTATPNTSRIVHIVTRMFYKETHMRFRPK